jgi:hypothetical protein
MRGTRPPKPTSARTCSESFVWIELSELGRVLPKTAADLSSRTETVQKRIDEAARAHRQRQIEENYAVRKMRNKRKDDPGRRISRMMKTTRTMPTPRSPRQSTTMAPATKTCGASAKGACQ